jgi:hypothetical protein
VKNNWMIVAAASLTLSAMTPAWIVRAEDPPPTNSNGVTPADSARRDPTAGSTEAAKDRSSSASAIDQRGIRDTLTTIVEDATTPGKFSDLMSHVAKRDPARATSNQPLNTNPPPPTPAAPPQRADAIPAAAPQRADDLARADSSAPRAHADGDLDAKIAQFQKDWRTKYNQDFKIRDAAQPVFTERFARIDTSNFGDAARTAGERIPPAKESADTNASPRSDTARIGEAGPRAPGADATAQKRTDDAVAGARAAGNRVKDLVTGSTTEYRAMVTIPESHGTPAATLALVSNGGSWKIELPANVDGKALQESLIRHLDMVDQDKASWPADVNDAYQAVSHHVLVAVSESAGTTDHTGHADRGANPGK